MGRWARASLWLGALALVLLGLLWLTPWGGFAISAVPVGNGVSAQLACGGVFVSGRTLDAVVKHDVWRLSPLTQKDSFALDRKAPSVTVTIFGLGARSAIFRPGIGCTLLADSDAATLRRQAEGIVIPPRMPRAGLWPEGDQVAPSPSVALASAVEASFADDTPAHDIDTRAIVVVHRGRIVAERYVDGFGPDTPQLGWSMSKSVTAALIGTFIASGNLRLDQPAPVPEWTVAGDPRHSITLRNLLNMSSGLAFNEPYDPGSDSTAMLFESHDMAGYAATRALAHPPGAFWSYSSGTANILSRIAMMKSGGTLKSLEGYTQAHLFGPLGMTSAVWEHDESGNFVGSSYLYASARDWARFGLFILNDGVVRGQRLLPEGYVHFLCTPAPADPDKGYGALFWLNAIDAKGKREFSHLPADYCAAEGHNDEFVAIFPSRDAVIVRLGWTANDFRFDRDKHFAAILAALED
ncbi:MAG: serine hydrolase, partial [Alphaproteobacteria bacterium]|nr:serine hydrolase [Alphaproteobacteria bacterium]MBV9693282.1 serine hydrolase [Alphaproteobacteria bacterium]